MHICTHMCACMQLYRSIAMYACINYALYTYIHTFMHAYIQAIQTHSYRCIHTYSYIVVHMHTYTCTCTCMFNYYPINQVSNAFNCYMQPAIMVIVTPNNILYFTQLQQASSIFVYACMHASCLNNKVFVNTVTPCSVDLASLQVTYGILWKEFQKFIAMHQGNAFQIAMYSALY